MTLGSASLDYLSAGREVEESLVLLEDVLALFGAQFSQPNTFLQLSSFLSVQL